MGKSEKKTRTEQKNKLPDYIVQGSKKAVGMASDLADRDYIAFGQQRMADLSENEQLGVEGFKGEFGRYDQDYDKARGALDSVGSFTDEGVREKYMNPFIEGVLQPAVRRRDRAFGEQKAELNRTSGMRGAFGGRKNVAEDLLGKSHQEGIDDLYMAGYGTAFDKAANLHGREQDRQLALAGEYGANAQRQASTNSQALREMMESGFVERTVDQSKMDFKYLEHLESRDWDVNNLSNLVSTLASVPSESSMESETVETTKPNPIKTMVGVAAIAAGAITMNPMLMSGGMSMMSSE